MSWVRATAILAMAAVLSATGPPSPMFSPAAVQCTPAAVSRAPRAASPGHWWESPQPPAIVALWAEALLSRPEEIVSGARPADERAWLTSASTCAAALPDEESAGLDAGAEADGDAEDGAEADDDGAVLGEEEALGVAEGPPAPGCRRRAGDDRGCADDTADGLAVT